jgi:hypothetical protein
VTESRTEDPNKKATLLGEINSTLKTYFDARRQRAQLRLKFERKQAKLTSKFEQEDLPQKAIEEEAAARLRELIVPNSALLISGKLRSFATNFGSVSFKKKPVTESIVDKASFERVARTDGTLKVLGTFTRTWKPKPIKEIKAWMASNPKRAKKYASLITENGGEDQLFVKPSDPYLKEYDPNRLTPESVNLGVVELKQVEQGPDA